MMKTVKQFFLGLIIISNPLSADTVVRMHSEFGVIDVQLHPESAPNTVANFLNYVSTGSYRNTFLHRSVPGFVLQGGTYALDESLLEVIEVPKNFAIENEFNLSNVRGTIGMAKQSGDPDSATNGWYFNLADNNSGSASSGNLDSQNEGFTVFGTIIEGLGVIDAIAALPVGPIPGFGDDFSNLPIADGGDTVDESTDLVVFNIEVIDYDLKINSGLNGFWFNSDTPGQGIGIEILPNLNTAFIGWFTHDTQTAASETPNEIGDATNRWMSSLGTVDADNNSITFDLRVTSGGLFDATTSVTNSEPNTVGTMTITFNDCESASVQYQIFTPIITGSFDMQRISNDNVELCKNKSLELIATND